MPMSVVIVIVVLAVLGFGLLIFWLMRKSQKEVPDVTDAHATRHPQVVGRDEQDRAITDADEAEAAPRDDAAFESILRDEIHDLGHEQPAADDD